MQSFETFESIFAFLVRSSLDQQYVDTIDTAVEQGTVSDETSVLIDRVRAFHKMRQTLCVRVFRHFEKDDVLQKLCRARGLVQYNVVPKGALCAMSGQALSDGCMFILNPNSDPTPMVVHSRFKLVLYQFWYLVHFVDEIMLDVRKWMHRQVWWRRGHSVNSEQIFARILAFGNGSFAKKHYVKLKGVTQNIQNAVAHGPINQTPVATA
tara:strand:+ start:295 stop:921 length:627 start_codon:yes stop_codon:yes gene_type:complete